MGETLSTEIGSGNVKSRGTSGGRYDFEYRVPGNAISVEIETVDHSSSGLNMGHGNGNATLNWHKGSRTAYVHAWVNGKMWGTNRISWTVRAVVPNVELQKRREAQQRAEEERQRIERERLRDQLERQRKEAELELKERAAQLEKERIQQEMEAKRKAELAALEIREAKIRADQKRAQQEDERKRAEIERTMEEEMAKLKAKEEANRLEVENKLKQVEVEEKERLSRIKTENDRLEKEQKLRHAEERHKLEAELKEREQHHNFEMEQKKIAIEEEMVKKTAAVFAITTPSGSSVKLTISDNINPQLAASLLGSLGTMGTPQAIQGTPQQSSASVPALAGPSSS